MRLLRFYLHVLEKHPWKTQTLTVGSLMCAGDAIAQLGVERRPIRKFDFKRSGRFLALGLCIGPVLRKWYLTLDKLFPGAGKLAAFQKMAADQVIFAPMFLFGFLSVITASQGKNAEQIRQKINQDYFPILTNNYKLWPATQLLNFYFVPLQHRIFVVQMVALGWNTYLAWVSEKQVTNKDDLNNNNDSDSIIVEQNECSTCAS